MTEVDWKEGADGDFLHAGFGAKLILRVHKTDFWWGVFHTQYKRAGGDALSLESAQRKAVEAGRLVLQLMDLEKPPQKRVWREPIELIRRSILRTYDRPYSDIPENARVTVVGTDLLFSWEQE